MSRWKSEWPVLPADPWLNLSEALGVIRTIRNRETPEVRAEIDATLWRCVHQITGTAEEFTDDILIKVTHDPSLDRRYVSSNPGTFGTPGISRPKEWWQIEATRIANEECAKTITHIRDGDGDD